MAPSRWCICALALIVRAHADTSSGAELVWGSDDGRCLGRGLRLGPCAGGGAAVAWRLEPAPQPQPAPAPARERIIGALIGAAGASRLVLVVGNAAARCLVPSGAHGVALAPCASPASAAWVRLPHGRMGLAAEHALPAQRCLRKAPRSDAVALGACEPSAALEFRAPPSISEGRAALGAAADSARALARRACASVARRLTAAFPEACAHDGCTAELVAFGAFGALLITIACALACTALALRARALHSTPAAFERLGALEPAKTSDQIDAALAAAAAAAAADGPSEGAAEHTDGAQHDAPPARAPAADEAPPAAVSLEPQPAGPEGEGAAATLATPPSSDEPPSPPPAAPSPSEPVARAALAPRAEARAAASARVRQLGCKLELADPAVQLRGKRLLLRGELNVPLLPDASIADDSRVRAILPAIHLARAKGCAAVAIVSHLGRPPPIVAAGASGGLLPAGTQREAQEAARQYSLRPVAEALAAMLGPAVPFRFVREGVLSSRAAAAFSQLPHGGVVLFENLRLHVGAERAPQADDAAAAALAEALGRLGDVYCCEAFGSAHRFDTSLVGALPMPLRCAGPHLSAELRALRLLLESPRRPFCAIVGGACLGSQLRLLEALVDVVDELVLGGPLALSIKQHAFRLPIGCSAVPPSDGVLVGALLQRVRERRVRLHLPCDYITADAFSPHATLGVAADSAGGVPEGRMVLDIGPRSVQQLCVPLGRAHTIVWASGPVGTFEFDRFAGGSKALIDAAAAAAERGAHVSLLSNDVGLCAAKFRMRERLGHVSTGGGAACAFIAGQPLPAVESLSDAPPKAPAPRPLPPLLSSPSSGSVYSTLSHSEPCLLCVFGFGRVGRAIVRRALLGSAGVRLVCIADAQCDATQMAYLLNYDSTHGRWPADGAELRDSRAAYGPALPWQPSADGRCLTLGGLSVAVLRARSAAECDWRSMGSAANLTVLDTQLCAHGSGQGAVGTPLGSSHCHLDNGAHRVVLCGAASSSLIPLAIPGLNAHSTLSASTRVCATGDGLAIGALPLLCMLERRFGVEGASAALIGPPLEGGRTVDSPAPGAGPHAGPHVDWRAGRGAGQNIAPAPNRLASAAASAVPSLAGRVCGAEWHVPGSQVSCIDLTVVLRAPVSVEAVHLALERWSARQPKRTVAVRACEASVSSDFVGCPRALTVDSSLSVRNAGGRTFKLVGWQHTECALAERALALARLGAAADRSPVTAALQAAEALGLLALRWPAKRRASPA